MKNYICNLLILMTIIFVLEIFSTAISTSFLDKTQNYYIVHRDNKTWRVSHCPARSIFGGIYFKNIDGNICRTSIFKSNIYSEKLYIDKRLFNSYILTNEYTWEF